jgi:hypothetical protein
MQIVVGGPTLPGAVVEGGFGFVVVVPASPAWRIDCPDAQAARLTQTPTARSRLVGWR